MDIIVNNQIYEFLHCEHEQQQTIIVKGEIRITNIKKSDLVCRWKKNYVYSFDFCFGTLRINQIDQVTNNISLHKFVFDGNDININGNSVSLELNDTRDKNIIFYIEVGCNGFDRRNVNSIDFLIGIQEKRTGGHNVDEIRYPIHVHLYRGFNCEACTNYYNNLFEITPKKILFTRPNEYDLATISINNNGAVDANFPVKNVNDIPNKQISLDGINFNDIQNFPYNYRQRIKNANNLDLTFRTGAFLCFDNGIHVNREIEVLNANNSLDVTINNNNTKTFAPDANGDINLGDIIMPSVGMTQDYTIVLSNTAQGTPNNLANHAYGLRINSVEVKNNTNQNELGKIEGWTNNSNNIEQDFLVGINNPPQNNNFINPKSTNEYFVIRLDSNHLGNIKVEDNINYINLRLKLTINYDIVVGAGIRNTSVTYDIIGRLFRRLPSVHHSIDFGTSAIVACSRIDGNINIIDLKTTKENLFNELNRTSREVERKVPKIDKDGNEIKDEKGNTEYETITVAEPILKKDKIRDNSEPDAGLIASSMAKREGDIVDIRTVGDYEQHRNHMDYYNESYWFSPTSELTHVDNHLPCLKTLIGINRIGNVDVRDVITDAYKQLCKYFLSNEQIESLALTIPNAFNSVHKQQLENIIYDNIKTIAKPYTFNGKKYSHLSFISESDSVLYSYIYNKIRGGNADKGDEYIFVYDMGAGTLDITYAKCSYEFNNQHILTCRSVEILGRSGINKAGNYIDYLLGEIIQDLLKDNDQKIKIEETLTKQDNPDLRKILKSYLRNSVKTSLNNDTQSKIPCKYYDDNNQLQTLTLQDVEITGIKNILIGDIINHKEFKKFVDDCTTNLLTDFRSVYGDKDALTVNTVVVSGRSVEINAIRQKIRQFFGDNVSYCRIDGRDFDGNNDNNNNNNGRTLKTAVAEGALAYMDYEQNKTENRPIYGHYGIIYKNPNGDRYIYGTKGNNPDLRNGILAGFYRNNEFEEGIHQANGDIVINRKIVVGRNDELWLYHSYYNIETISKDIEENRLDKISILCKSGGLPSGNCYITLTIHADHTLQYSASLFGNGVLQVHADLNSDTLRKSIWPCSVR